MVQPPRWCAEELEKSSREATVVFRNERLEEPLEDYLRAFDEYTGSIEGLFETTLDLTELDETAVEFLADPKLFEAFDL